MASPFRRQPERLSGISRRERGLRPGRNRVLAAAVLRPHRDPVRLPARFGARHRAAPGARAGGRLLAGHGRALRATAARQRAPGPGSRGALPCAGRVRGLDCNVPAGDHPRGPRGFGPERPRVSRPHRRGRRFDPGSGFRRGRARTARGFRASVRAGARARTGRVRDRHRPRPSRRRPRTRSLRPVQTVPRTVPGSDPAPRRVAGPAGDPRGNPAAPRPQSPSCRGLDRIPARPGREAIRNRSLAGRVRGDSRRSGHRPPARGASIRTPGRDPAADAGTGCGERHSRSHRAQVRRSGGSRALRGGTIPGAHDPDRGRSHRRVPEHRVRGSRSALRAGALAAPRLALCRRRARSPAQARQPAMAQGAQGGCRTGARRRGRAPGGPGAARGAGRERHRVRRRAVRRVCRGLPLRGDPGSGGGDRRDPRGPAQRTSDGPARLRGRGVRQDGGRDAGRIRGGDGRLAGRDSGADDPPRAAALPDLHRSFRRLAGAHRATLPVPIAAPPRGDHPRPRRGADRNRDRNPPRASGRRQVQASRAGDRRRGASFRRAS